MDNKSAQNVVIDTNVIVSAFLSSHEDTSTVLVLKKLYKKEILLYYSKKILEEYKDVLNRKKFGFDKKEINRFINFILQKGRIIEPAGINEKLIDEKDKPFYEIVMDKRVAKIVLITGNKKHFPSKTFIVSPTEFIESLKKI